uniref:Uncharacterized protein n=1 Tax=Anguilla anguilla TaxID=7936 RepID=A0A0E9UGZ1_ANGAN
MEYYEPCDLYSQRVDKNCLFWFYYKITNRAFFHFVRTIRTISEPLNRKKNTFMSH